MSQARLIDPEPVPPPSEARPGPGAVLTADQVNRWRTEGHTFVDGLFSDDLIAELASTAEAHFPRPGSAESRDVSNFGSNLNFPAELPALNRVTLHRRLLSAVAQLLGTEVTDLRLTQSDLWIKYGRTERVSGQYDNQDQRIHVDYPNHTLVHPSPWDRPEAVEAILYLSDHDHCHGSTAVVPRRGPDDELYRWPIVDSPGIAGLPYINDRDSAEQYLDDHRPDMARWRQGLYDREVHTRFRPGSIIFYRHDTWHRGTPLKPGTSRLAQNISFRRAECEWISTVHKGWAWAMYRPSMTAERLIGEASLDQRAVLGFPQPGASYWSAETLEAVTARYGPFGFDPAPYREQLQAAQR